MVKIPLKAGHHGSASDTLGANYGQTLNASLVFQGIWISVAEKPNFFGFCRPPLYPRKKMHDKHSHCILSHNVRHSVFIACVEHMCKPVHVLPQSDQINLLHSKIQDTC